MRGPSNGHQPIGVEPELGVQCPAKTNDWDNLHGFQRMFFLPEDGPPISAIMAASACPESHAPCAPLTLGSPNRCGQDVFRANSDFIAKSDHITVPVSKQAGMGGCLVNQKLSLLNSDFLGQVFTTIMGMFKGGLTPGSYVGLVLQKAERVTKKLLLTRETSTTQRQHASMSRV